MSKYTPNSPNTIGRIRAELDKIKEALDDQLDRVPDGGQANQMEADLDMNGNWILNHPAPRNSNDLVRLHELEQVIIDANVAGVVPVQQPRQQGDGVTTVFSAPNTEVVSPITMFVNIDGVSQRPFTDFNVTAISQITFSEAPPANSDIDITFFEPNVVEDPNVSDRTVVSTGSTEARTLANRFAEVANVRDFGARGDGETDDTASINAAIESGASVVVFPVGDYRGSITISNLSDRSFEFQTGASLRSFGSTAVVSLTSCSNVNVVGGAFRSEDRTNRTIALTNCNSCKLENIRSFWDSKSTYSGDAIYNAAGVFLDSCTRCEVVASEVYNIEGAGVNISNTGNGNRVCRCYIHDNVTGILNNGDDNNFNRFIDNDIGFNNVSPGSGNDGILINATSIEDSSTGHHVSGNRIYNNGEHGVYGQCSNTLYNNNTVYANASCGIKVAKCRDVTVEGNICRDQDTNLQVQSGYDEVLITGNQCRNATSIDIDFTYNESLDPFGGGRVKIIGNNLQSTSSSWSIDPSGTPDIYIEGNHCARGLIYGAIAPGIKEGLVIRDNVFGGTIRWANTVDAIISGNRCENIWCNTTNSGTVFENNFVTDLQLSARKDVTVHSFSSICNNKIIANVASGAPFFEVFNGQDESTDKIRIIGNDIASSGAIIFNINGAGINLTDSVMADNIFQVVGGGPAVTTQASGSIITGNVGLSGQQIVSGCIVKNNTGTPTFVDNGGNILADNL